MFPRDARTAAHQREHRTGTELRPRCAARARPKPQRRRQMAREPARTDPDHRSPQLRSGVGDPPQILLFFGVADRDVHTAFGESGERRDERVRAGAHCVESHGFGGEARGPQHRDRLGRTGHPRFAPHFAFVERHAADEDAPSPRRAAGPRKRRSEQDDRRCA